MKENTCRIPTELELNNFIRIENINPIMIKNMENKILIVDDDVSEYMLKLTYLSVNKLTGKFDSAGSAARYNSNAEPIDFMLSSFEGKTVFLIKLNCNTLVQETDKILVKLKNREQVIGSANNEKYVLMISNDSNNSQEDIFVTEIILFDIDNKILYKCQLNHTNI